MKRPRRGVLMNTTSMLDVIFILLLFFVAVSKIRDGTIDLKLPSAEGKTVESSGKKDDEITVAVDKQDQLKLNGRTVGKERELLQALKQEAAGGSQRRIVFLADRESHSGRLVSALKAVTEAGFQDISFVYQPQEPKP